MVVGPAGVPSPGLDFETKSRVFQLAHLPSLHLGEVMKVTPESLTIKLTITTETRRRRITIGQGVTALTCGPCTLITIAIHFSSLLLHYLHHSRHHRAYLFPCFGVILDHSDTTISYAHTPHDSVPMFISINPALLLQTAKP